MNAARRSSMIAAALLCMLSVSATRNSATKTHAFLLVANKADRSVSIVDPEAGREVAAVPVGGITVHEVAASPDGSLAWAPIYGNSGVGRSGTDGQTLSVIDLKTRKIVDTIDPTSRKIIASIPTGERESHMLAISSDGKRGYTSNVGAGSVSAIDLVNKKVLAIIPVSGIAQRIALSPDDRWVVTADQKKPQLAVIDTQSNKVARWVPLPDVAFGTRPTQDGNWLLITQPASSKVAVLNLHTMTIEHQINVPPAPQEILLRPDGKVAYVSCDRSKQVAEIDLASWKVNRLINVGAGADGLAWAASGD